MAIDLSKAVACVTGGGRGIGAATARALAKRGAQVVIGDIDLECAQAVAEEIGPQAMAVALDVADTESFEAFLAAARTRGPVTLLVNNAGIQRTGEFISQPLSMQWREIAINLGGVINGMRLVLPEMLAEGCGHIVNVASMAGKMTVPGAAVYSASKFGVASLSRAVRSEIAASPVTLTTILPAAVETDLIAGLDTRGVPTVTPDAVARAVVASCRHGRPEVTLPRWLTPFAAIEQVIPECFGERIKHAVGAQQRLSTEDQAARQYQARTSRS